MTDYHLLKVSEAAKRLGMSQHQLWQLVHGGQIKSVRRGVRFIRIPEWALLEWTKKVAR